MDWIVFGAQWLHILAGILWFGNSLIITLIVIPALSRVPIPIQRQVGAYVGEQADRVLDVAGPAVIVLGFVRGTLLGPIKTIDDAVATVYGMTRLVALVIAILTLLWGRVVIRRGLRAMNLAPLNADGTVTPELQVAMERVKRLVALELVGFFAIFTCMILMRFGL